VTVWSYVGLAVSLILLFNLMLVALGLAAEIRHQYAQLRERASASRVP
jgi:hypothetical protein